MANSIVSERSKAVLPWILGVTIFMQMLETTILNTALPTMAKDLGESPLQMQSTIISYALTLAICTPLSGIISDKFGTKYTFIISLFVFTLGSLFCALSMNLTQLNLSRVLQGVGGALSIPVARLSIFKTYPKSDILRIMNYAITPALIGPMLGPILGGYLVQYLSWHWVFLINLPIGLICLSLAIFFMPDYKADNVKMDYVGYVLFAASISLLILGLQFISRQNNEVFSMMLLCLGLLLLVSYWIYAYYSTSPLYSVELFKIRTFVVGIFGGILARLGIASIPFVVPLLLQVGMGYTPELSGWMLVPLALANLINKPMVTTIMRWYGYKKVLIINTLLISILIMVMGFVAPHVHAAVLIALLFALGFCNSIQFSAMNTLTIADLTDDNVSSGNSLMLVVQQASLTLAIAFAAIFMNIFAHVPMAYFDHKTEPFQATMIIMGLFTLFSTLVFVILKGTDGDNMANRTIKR
ncbi:MFS transporter [Wohlfahrtiimonas sp. G9077]|uniref:MFS transporter n=1 Tax=Wohlfahrtiimonas sp. G9077 TaxID=1980118 RepID=UPI000B97CB23|nr:MFS transporter [Wohlfahrtiimonas sp. G9077]OYQ72442.1 MFS transporter [Wohlfahrtiimonas sp. G9077]